MIFENLAKNANLERIKMKILNANVHLRQTPYFDSLQRGRKPFFNILSGPIYHIWKSSLGGP